jgi:hypothetical protein
MKRRSKATTRLQSVLDPTLEKPLLHLHAAIDVDSFWKAVQNVIQAALPSCFIGLMRVVNTSRSSNGALAMEKVRTFPSESVSGGFSNVRSADCPRLKSNPTGFSKWKAIVPSATSTLSTAWRRIQLPEFLQQP